MKSFFISVQDQAKTSLVTTAFLLLLIQNTAWQIKSAYAKG